MNMKKFLKNDYGQQEILNISKNLNKRLVKEGAFLCRKKNP
jgi:hypothetical protein